jgi:transcriptional regulator with XRE-family HTH domain
MFDYKVFEKLCKEQNRSVTEVMNSTGIESATIYSWKAKCEGRDGYYPKADKILKIAEFFNVSLEDFVTKRG